MGEAKRRKQLDPNYGKRWQKAAKLLTDYGAMVLKSELKTVNLCSEGGNVTAVYYPSLKFAEFSMGIGEYMATIQIPCEKRQVPQILERLSGGFYAELKPNESKSFVTPNKTERVIPLEIVNLDEFMASVEAA